MQRPTDRSIAPRRRRRGMSVEPSPTQEKSERDDDRRNEHRRLERFLIDQTIPSDRKAR
jgi:hypothetical protein